MRKDKMLNIEEQTPLWFVLIIIVCYGIYSVLPPAQQEYAIFAGALIAENGHILLEGRPVGNLPTLLTHVLLHANWTHVLMNAGMMLAFGVITIRGVKNRYTLVKGRFERGSLVYLLFILCGAIFGGLLQWAVWIFAGESGIAVGASTAGMALFAGTAWALGGAKRLLIFGLVVVAYDLFVLSTNGFMGGLGNPSWAGHIGGYLAGAALAPMFLKPSSVGIGNNISG